MRRPTAGSTRESTSGRSAQRARRFGELEHRQHVHLVAEARAGLASTPPDRRRSDAGTPVVTASTESDRIGRSSHRPGPVALAACPPAARLDAPRSASRPRKSIPTDARRAGSDAAAARATSAVPAQRSTTRAPGRSRRRDRRRAPAHIEARAEQVVQEVVAAGDRIDIPATVRGSCRGPAEGLTGASSRFAAPLKAGVGAAPAREPGRSAAAIASARRPSSP